MCAWPAGLDLDLDDNSSVVTAGGSEEQQEFSDSASFSIPSLELSDGLTVAAATTSMDLEDSPSLSCSAPGPEPSSMSTEVPALKEGLLEAHGEAPLVAKRRTTTFNPVVVLIVSKWIIIQINR